MQEHGHSAKKLRILIAALTLIILLVGFVVFRTTCTDGADTSSWKSCSYGGISFRIPSDWKEDDDPIRDYCDHMWFDDNYDLECFVQHIDAENNSDLYKRYKAKGIDALVESKTSNFSEPEYITIKVKEKKEIEIDGVKCLFLRFTFLEQYPGDTDYYDENFCLWIPLNDGESVTEILLTNYLFAGNDGYQNGVLKGIINSVSISKDN